MKSPRNCFRQTLTKSEAFGRAILDGKDYPQSLQKSKLCSGLTFINQNIDSFIYSSFSILFSRDLFLSLLYRGGLAALFRRGILNSRALMSLQPIRPRAWNMGRSVEGGGVLFFGGLFASMFLVCFI